MPAGWSSNYYVKGLGTLSMRLCCGFGVQSLRDGCQERTWLPLVHCRVLRPNTGFPSIRSATYRLLRWERAAANTLSAYVGFHGSHCSGIRGATPSRLAAGAGVCGGHLDRLLCLVRFTGANGMEGGTSKQDLKLSAQCLYAGVKHRLYASAWALAGHPCQAVAHATL
jgi:hypothetical protein